MHQTMNENDTVPAQPQSTHDCTDTNVNSSDEGVEQNIYINDEESAMNKAEEREKCSCSSIPLLACGTDSSSITNNGSDCTKSQQTYQSIPQFLNANDEMLECTICQEEYKPSERICRSSNSKCKHVFHEVCIVHWLVSLGWMKLKEPKVLPESLMKDEKNLLNYDLECPCCRQLFLDTDITSLNDAASEERGEEIV